MKQCDHFKDLILTDFMDGQLDKDAALKVERHLLDCRVCRVFFKEVQDNTALPLRQTLRQPVPAELWSAIKENLENIDQAEHPFAGFFGNLKRMFEGTKLVPVFASFILMFLAGSVTLNTVQIQQSRDKDQGEYLVSLLSPAGAAPGLENNDLGTPIEHYFL